jgi:hypothetical protein
MTEFHFLTCQMQLAGAPGGEKNPAHWNLGGQTQGVGLRGTVWNDYLALTLFDATYDHLDRRRSGSESRPFWLDVQTAANAQKTIAGCQSRKRLIDGCPIPQMKESLGCKEGALGFSGGVFEDVPGK